MTTMNLTLSELKEVTGKTHRQKQAIVLAVLQIPFKIRPDGTILVSRDAYQLAMGCNSSKPETLSKQVKPNFNAI